MPKKTIVNTFFMKPVLEIPDRISNDYKPILNKRTILLAAHDVIELELLGNDLNIGGYYCLLAKGEDDTMETLRLINASVVILDTDGLTINTSIVMASKIRTFHPSTRILVLTSIRDHQFTSIADAVLIRPFKTQQLYDALSFILT